MKRAWKWGLAAIAGTSVAAWALWPSAKQASRRAFTAKNAGPMPLRDVMALPFGMTPESYEKDVREFVASIGVGQNQWNDRMPTGVPSWIQQASAHQIKTWGERSKALYPNIKTKESPAYIELYRGPWANVYLFESGAWRWTSRNRYGQHAPGKSTNLFGAAAAAAGYVLPMVPGVGTAANAALQGAIALGQGKSLKDAAFAAVRGTLPPWGQVAFDLGVGVALQGKSIDQAAIDAGLQQLEAQYPGARQAYNDGKDLAKGAK